MIRNRIKLTFPSLFTMEWRNSEGTLTYAMTSDKQGSRDTCTIHLVTREQSLVMNSQVV